MADDIDAKAKPSWLRVVDSGTRHLQEKTATKDATEEVYVPRFYGDILRDTAPAGHSDPAIGVVIRNYQMIETNIEARMENLRRVLYGRGLAGSERIDIQHRLARLDRSRLEVKRNLEQAQQHRETNASRQRELTRQENAQRLEDLEDVEAAVEDVEDEAIE